MQIRQSQSWKRHNLHPKQKQVKQPLHDVLRGHPFRALRHALSSRSSQVILDIKMISMTLPYIKS